MGTGMNKVFLIGHLGAPPELKRHNDRSKLKFRMATTERWKDKTTGEEREETQWHHVSLWGPRAEKLLPLLDTGDKVVVEGKIRYFEVVGADGSKKYFTNVDARDIHFAGGRRHRTPKAGGGGVFGQADDVPF